MNRVLVVPQIFVIFCLTFIDELELADTKRGPDLKLWNRALHIMNVFAVTVTIVPTYCFLHIIGAKVVATVKGYIFKS